MSVEGVDARLVTILECRVSQDSVFVQTLYTYRQVNHTKVAILCNRLGKPVDMCPATTPSLDDLKITFVIPTDVCDSGLLELTSHKVNIYPVLASIIFFVVFILVTVSVIKDRTYGNIETESLEDGIYGHVGTFED